MFCLSVRADADVKVRIGYTALADFASVFIAKEQGIFARNGIDAELIQIALNSTMPAALVSRSFDLAGVTPPVFVQAVAGGLDLVIVSGVSVVTNDLNFAALVRPQSGIKQPKDFEGKKVGIPGIGATLHVLFVRWLKNEGVDPKRVTFIETPFPTQLDLLRTGTIDAVVTAQPNVDSIVAAATGTIMVNLGTGLEGLSGAFWVSTAEWAGVNPDVAKKIKASVAEAGKFIDANPAAARADIAKYIKLPPKMLEAILLPKVVSDVEATNVAWWFDVLLDQKLIEKKLNVDALILK